MPKGTKVSDCVEKLKAKGYSEESAIRICQKSTGLSYMTGKKPKSSKKSTSKKSSKSSKSKTSKK